MKNEIRVISSVVRNKDIAPALSSSNIDNLFTSYKDVWEYIKDYYYKYRSVVPEDIISEKFDIDIIETSGTVKHYLEQLTDEYQQHQLERISRGLAKDLGSVPTQSLIDAVQSRMVDLANVSSNVRDLDITDNQKAIDHYIDTRQKMEANGGVLGIKTGFMSIDANYPTGMAPGQYIVILSRTGQGKSWLALELALNAWAQGKKILYVSLEMPPESVRDRAYTFMSEGKFGMSDLARAQIDIDEIKTWSNELLKSDQSFIVTASDGMGDFSPAHLQAKIDQYAPDIVYVDYLQLMSDRRNSSGSTDRVRSTSKEVKSLAMTNGVPIVMVAAASMNETKEYNSPPQIYECAESRQAVFDVDLCLSLISHKQGNATHRMEMISRKNRHGPEFGFYITLDIPNGTMREEWDEEGLIDE